MRQSQLITKTRKETGQQDPSINAQLLERGGYIAKLMAGVYSYLPLGLKVLHTIEAIVRSEMDQMGQEILMPALQPRENWDITGRWDTVDVLFKLKGAGDRDLALGPTHEDVVTPLVGSYIQSYKDLPKAVYQIQTKFRNEARAKSGLLRGREFRMKDLYSFHAQQEELDCYYEAVKACYLRIFARCGLADITYFTYALGGIFSKYSHEFQTITPHGEDTTFLCTSCNIGINKELIEEMSACPECNTKNLEPHKSIEVGNIFKLGTRFTQPFTITYTAIDGTQQPVVMGCYGLGTSRLMGAIVEALHDQRGIIWPVTIAPYKVHLISLMKDPAGQEQADSIYKLLQEKQITVLYDDRAHVTAGEKFADADLLGMPYRLVVSTKTVAQESVELKVRRTGATELIPLAHLVSRIYDLGL